MGGTYGTQAWWWAEEDKYPLAKFFVEDFQKKNNYQPEWGASEVYIQLLVWADAVERAGTFYPIEVIKALESGTKVNSIYGEVYYRAGDHQMVRPVPVMVGKKPNEMKGPNDFFRIVDLVPGEQRAAAARSDRLQDARHQRLNGRLQTPSLKGRPTSGRVKQARRGRPIRTPCLADVSSLSDAPAAAEGDISLLDAHPSPIPLTGL